MNPREFGIAFVISSIWFCFLSSPFFFLPLPPPTERKNIWAISPPKEQEPNWQKMTTGCWQHYKDNRRGMSNLHHVTCPRSNISGCQPGESKVEKTCQAGYSLWLGRQFGEPCSPFNTNINHTIGTVILFHFSLSLPLCPVGHRQRLTRSFWFLFNLKTVSP